MLFCAVAILMVLQPSKSHVLPNSPTDTMDTEQGSEPLSNHIYEVPDQQIDAEHSASIQPSKSHIYEDPNQQIDAEHSDELSEPPSSDDHLDPLSVIMEENILCSWYVLLDEQGAQINLDNFQVPVTEDDLPKPFKSSDSTCLDSAISSFPFISCYQAAAEQEKKDFLAETISPYLEAESDELHAMDKDELVPLFNMIMFNSKAMSLPPCFIPANTSSQHRSVIEKLVSEAYSMSPSETSFLQRLNGQALLALAEQAVEGVSKAKACQASVTSNCGKCKKCRERCANSCDICEEKVMKAFLSHTSRSKRYDHDHHHHDTHHSGSGLTFGWNPLTGLGVGWTPSPLWSSSSNYGHDLHVDLMPTPFGVQPVIHKDNLVIPLNINSRTHAWNTGFNRGGNYGFNHGGNYGFNPRWNSGFHSGWNMDGYGRKRRSVEQQNYLKVYMHKYFEKMAKESESMFKSSRHTIPECSNCVKCNIGCREPCLKCLDWKCQEETP